MPKSKGNPPLKKRQLEKIRRSKNTLPLESASRIETGENAVSETGVLVAADGLPSDSKPETLQPSHTVESGGTLTADPAPPKAPVEAPVEASPETPRPESVYGQEGKSLFTLRPVVTELVADTETPVSLYLKLRRQRQSKYSCLLESVEGEERLARFSYIGIEPVAVLSGTVEGKIELEVRDKRFKALAKKIQRVESGGDVQGAIQTALSAFASPTSERSVKLPEMMTSGAIGYIGYDALHLTEKIPMPRLPEPAALDDVCLMFFDTLIVFDNVKRKLFIVTNTLAADPAAPEQVEPREQAEAEQRLKKIRKKIFVPLRTKDIRLSEEREEKLRSNIAREAYLKNVRTAKDYIEAGDIFQVQLSQRLTRKLNAKPFDVYRMLRTLNPSPYLYYLELPEAQIIGSSPELLVRVDKIKTVGGEQRVVQTRPIAGTKKRGQTPQEDEANAAALLADEKERAEHLMLIDLGRNDIGRVAKTGSVETTEMMVIEKYSHVMHIVSHIKGVLKNEKDKVSPMEAFWSCFPAGTLTGAPKIRAMEIISELEAEKRGLYGGAVGYFDFNGNLNTAIAIRTMVVRDGKIYFQAAGGIVADSVPENEFEETMQKMSAGLAALQSLIPS